MTGDANALRITRIFEAPRELVFRQWTEAAHLETWFAPDGYSCTECAVDARVGGRWRVAYRSQRGDAHIEFGEFREIAPPERLTFTLTQRSERGETAAETTVIVTFKAIGPRTEMTFLQTGFESAKRRDGNAAGWNECFRKLDDHIAEAEIRAPGT